jgi:predicted ATP-grasp superfamily ATP-dependent carboligase
VPDFAALHALWPRLVAVGMEILAQELVPGPETRIESYHVYVDEAGGIAGEFTGRKIRTYPEAYGHSTALEITDARDVRDQGRDFVHRLNLKGIAKFDFKRGPDGVLHLLEINPRFNLWHHLGAVAGVNLPALVHADIQEASGLQSLPRGSGRAGARSGTIIPPQGAGRAACEMAALDARLRREIGAELG